MEELWKAMERAGLELNHFSGHGFRIGTATTATVRGIPDSQIKLLGGWKSTAFQFYLKLLSMQITQLAGRLAQMSPLPGQHDRPEEENYRSSS